MYYVYLVQHSRPIVNDEYNESDDVYDTKIIGIYSTKEKANIVIKRYKTLEGFCDYPNNFYIDKYNIDEENWKEGFITPE
ncbi:MAG TPA: hypothetical protein GX710_09010 [Clostridiales bacterium]|nr:hypothetical protein [Clostridiales bacterium]